MALDDASTAAAVSGATAARPLFGNDDPCTPGRPIVTAPPVG